MVLVACFIATFSYGVAYSFGVFITPLEKEFACSRTAISGVYSVSLGIGIFSQIAIGRITDKYGPRLPLFLAAVCAGGGTALLSQAHSLAQVYLFFGLASLTVGAQVGALPSSVIQRWFVKKRGLVLGVVVSGMGAGPFVFAPLGGYLITSYDWRTAYLILGIIVGALVLLAAFLISAAPEKKGLKPYGAEKLPSPGAKNEPQTEVGQVWTVREALRTRAFLTICGYYTLTFLCVALLSTHFDPLVTASPLKLDKEVADLALGLIGGVSIAGRIGWGGLTPGVVGWKQGLAVSSIICALMMLWLLGTQNPLMLWVFVAVYGFFHGARTPLIPGAISLYFGTKSLSSLVGIGQAIGMAGNVIGALLGGIIYDLTGSYFIALVVCVICWAAASFLALTLKPPYPHEEVKTGVN